MSDRDRLESIRFFLKKNKTEFAKILGYSSPQSYTNYLSGSNNLSMKMIKALKKYDSRISIDWIIEGQGEMLTGGQSNNTQTIKNRDGTISNVTNNGSNTTIESSSSSIALETKVEHLTKEIEHLTKEVGHLTKMLEDKEEIIRLLKR